MEQAQQKQSESAKLYDKLLQDFEDMRKPNANKKSIKQAKKMIFEVAFNKTSWRGGHYIYSAINTLERDGHDKKVFKDTKHAGHFSSEIFHFRRKQAFENFASLLHECNLSVDADFDDFDLKCRKDLRTDPRFKEIDDQRDRRQLFYEFKKNLTTPKDSIREREEVQEDKEEVVTSQQEKVKAADELQRNMDNSPPNQRPCYWIKQGLKCHKGKECKNAHSIEECTNETEKKIWRKADEEEKSFKRFMEEETNKWKNEEMDKMLGTMFDEESDNQDDSEIGPPKSQDGLNDVVIEDTLPSAEENLGDDKIEEQIGASDKLRTKKSEVDSLHKEEKNIEEQIDVSDIIEVDSLHKEIANTHNQNCKQKQEKTPETQMEELKNVAPKGDDKIKAFGLVLDRRDLGRLLSLDPDHNERLANDNLINFYFKLIEERSRTNDYANGWPIIRAMPTQFFENLKNRGYKNVERWTRKDSLFSYHQILIPLHFPNHWALATIDPKSLVIKLYDSNLAGSSSDQRQALIILKHYLRKEYQSRFNQAPTNDIQAIKVLNTPQQGNGVDCGIFTAISGRCISENIPLNDVISQEAMPYFRKKMFSELVAKKLEVGNIIADEVSNGKLLIRQFNPVTMEQVLKARQGRKEQNMSHKIRTKEDTNSNTEIDGNLPIFSNFRKSLKGEADEGVTREELLIDRMENELHNFFVDNVDDEKKQNLVFQISCDLVEARTKEKFDEVANLIDKTAFKSGFCRKLFKYLYENINMRLYENFLAVDPSLALVREKLKETDVTIEQVESWLAWKDPIEEYAHFFIEDDSEEQIVELDTPTTKKLEVDSLHKEIVNNDNQNCKQKPEKTPETLVEETLEDSISIDDHMEDMYSNDHFHATPLDRPNVTMDQMEGLAECVVRMLSVESQPELEPECFDENGKIKVRFYHDKGVDYLATMPQPADDAPNVLQDIINGDIIEDEVTKEGLELMVQSLELKPQLYHDRIMDLQLHCKVFAILIQHKRLDLCKLMFRAMKPGLIEPGFWSSTGTFCTSDDKFDLYSQFALKEISPSDAEKFQACSVPYGSNSFWDAVSFHRTGGYTYAEDIKVNTLRAMMKYQENIENYAKQMAKRGDPQYKYEDYLQEMVKIATGQDDFSKIVFYACSIAIQMTIILKTSEGEETFSNTALNSMALKQVTIFGRIQEHNFQQTNKHFVPLMLKLESYAPAVVHTYENHPYASLEDPYLVLQLLIDPAIETLTNIPDGNKSGEPKYVVKNPNIIRRGRKKHPRDNRGAWKSYGYTIYVFELKGDKFKRPRDLQWSKELNHFVSPKNFTSRIVPDGSRQLFVTERYYYYNKKCPELKKKWLYFTQTPLQYSDVKQKVFFEYLGTDSMPHLITDTHGNTDKKNKFSKQPYRALNAHKVVALHEAVVHGKDNYRTFRELDDPNNPLDSIQEARQITQHRYYLKKSTNDILGNTATQIAQIFRELANDKSHYVKLLQEKNGQSKPSLLAYLPWQIDAINEYSTTGSRLLYPTGWDRSFNLGKYFVTSMATKCLGVTVKKRCKGGKDDHPMMPLATFYQEGAKFSDYDVMAHNVALALKLAQRKRKEGEEEPRYVWVIDGEKALENALKFNFKDCVIFGCQIHLKKNVDTDLIKSKELTKEVRQDIHRLLWGKYGLSRSMDRDEFDVRKELLEDEYGKHFKNFQHHTEKVWTYQVVPGIATGHRCGFNVTNNIIEALNGNLKRRQDWKQLGPKGQVQTAYDEAKKFESSLVKAFYKGRSEFTLTEGKAALLEHVTTTTWSQYTNQQREDVFKLFFREPSVPFEYSDQIVSNQDATLFDDGGQVSLPSKADLNRFKPQGDSKRGVRTRSIRGKSGRSLADLEQGEPIDSLTVRDLKEELKKRNIPLKNLKNKTDLVNKMHEVLNSDANIIEQEEILVEDEEGEEEEELNIEESEDDSKEEEDIIGDYASVSDFVNDVLKESDEVQITAAHTQDSGFGPDLTQGRQSPTFKAARQEELNTNSVNKKPQQIRKIFKAARKGTEKITKILQQQKTARDINKTEVLVENNPNNETSYMEDYDTDEESYPLKEKSFYTKKKKSIFKMSDSDDSPIYPKENLQFIRKRKKNNINLSDLEKSDDSSSFNMADLQTTDDSINESEATNSTKNPRKKLLRKCKNTEKARSPSF